MSNPNYQVVHEPEDQSAEYFEALKLQDKSLFKWQRKAFNKAVKKGGKRGRDHIVRFFAIQAPCGCGKTTLLIALAIYDIISSDWKQKQLIIVPQSHVGLGFTEEPGSNYISIQVKRKKYQWAVLKDCHNFCHNELNERRTKKLKKWLLASPSELAEDFREGKVISGLNAVCCYQSLIRVWKQLTEKEKRRAIRYLSLSVDEAHHLKHIYLEEGDFETEEEKEIAREEATEIGNICTYIMNSDIKTSKIRTTSATMYRGDRKFIFSSSVKKKFVSFYYSWADHFKTLGITNFKFLFEEYSGDPINQMVDNILREPNKRHLVIFPSHGHKWRMSFAKELELFISKLVNGGIPRKEINDLITKGKQSTNKARLLSEPKKFNPDTPPKFRVVIICKLGREGTDWCPCDRIHNASPESTLTLAMQTIGRLLRRYEGKEDIIAATYIQKFVPIRDITSRELLSDRTNAILLCMQLNENLMPIVFPVIPLEKKKDRKKKVKTNLEEYLGDDYQNIQKEMIGRYEGIKDKTTESVKEMLRGLLAEYEITENIEVLTNALLAQVTRAAVDCKKITALEFEGINVDFVRKGGFDKMQKAGKLKDSIYFGNIKKKDFHVIKKIIEKHLGILKDMTYEDACKYVREELGLNNMREWEEWKAKQPRVEASRYEFEDAV